MTESNLGEQKSTEKAKTDIPLSDALRVVLKAISDEEDRLMEIANTSDEDTTLLKGETFTGYTVHVMANSAKVAQIMLKYKYPRYDIMGEVAPKIMWRELAGLVGLRDVYSVDL